MVTPSEDFELSATSDEPEILKNKIREHWNQQTTSYQTTSHARLSMLYATRLAIHLKCLKNEPSDTEVT